MSKVLKLITGNSNKKLSSEIADYLETSLVDTLVTKFSDGEIRVQINENVRGADVFVIQSLTSPVNDSIMELLLILDALKGLLHTELQPLSHILLMQGRTEKTNLEFQ